MAFTSRPKSLQSQSGVVLILLLAVILVSFTGVLVANTSIDKLKRKNVVNSSLRLTTARDALLAYSLDRFYAGVLPCPDTDYPADGLENRTSGICDGFIGWLPYKTLGIDKLVDTSGTVLWYSVAPFVTDKSVTARINPSQVNTFKVDAIESVAVVIAPGQPLQGQTRNSVTTTGFLEGQNAIANQSFEQSISDDNNDLVLALESIDYFNVVQPFVVKILADKARSYKSACGQYPWAGNFNLGDGTSISGLQQGSFPSKNSQPAQWGAGCASSISLPQHMVNSWHDHLLYGFCLDTEGACLTFDATPATTATAVLISPGMALASQVRVNQTVTDYFEGGNSDGLVPFSSIKIRHHSPVYNDHTYVIE